MLNIKVNYHQWWIWVDAKLEYFGGAKK